MSVPHVALTGATGFIGSALLADMRAHGYRVRVLLRRPVDGMLEADSAVIGDLIRPMNLSRALEDIDVVVHSAAIAGSMTGHPDDDYRAINTDATIALATAARRAGVRRFVFLSSVRAQSGPSSETILDEDAPAKPTDAYGRSKLAAEVGLGQIGLEWAALRSVLVYGPGAQGNIAALLRLARSRWPVPLPYPSGRRSLLALENLAEAVRTVISTRQPLTGPYLVSDDEALDVAAIIKALRSGGRLYGPRVPVPDRLFRYLASGIGYENIYDRLASDLIVDNSRLKLLGWQPRVTTEAGLKNLCQSQV